MPRRGSAPPFSPCRQSRITSRRFAPRCSRSHRSHAATHRASSSPRADPSHSPSASTTDAPASRRVAPSDATPPAGVGSPLATIALTRRHPHHQRSCRRPLAIHPASPPRVWLGARAPSPDARPAYVRSRCAAPSSPRTAPSCDPSASNADASVARRVTSSDPTVVACVSLWSRLLSDERSHRRPVLTDRVPQTHALASATLLGPDRLHSCHMSRSTAKPLWLSHPTHR